MKRVLIVIDMQEDFVRGSLGSKDAEAIVSKVKAKITEYMERGDKIIFTRDTHRENYLEKLEGKNLPVEHCIYGTEGWRIIPELVDDCKEYPDCSFIDKVTFGYENWKDIFGTVDEYGIELVGLCHYPLAVWDQSHRGSYHLYGHIHNNLSEDEKTPTDNILYNEEMKNAYNVGCMLPYMMYTPRTLDYILKKTGRVSR